MPTPVNRPPGLLAAALAALLLVGGCSAAGEPATPGPLATLASLASAPPTPTRRPTPSPAPTPSPTAIPTPTPEPEPDLASELRIGAPYKLVANRANKALTGSFTFDIAGTHIEAVINGREIRRSGTLVGVALVLEMSGIKVNREVFDAAARGVANGRTTFSTILGQRVAFVTNSRTTVGMYVLHSAIIMVGGVKATDTKALLTSVIKANLAAP